MALRTCQKCGKTYEATLLGGGLCESCNNEQMDKYHEVREYLWNHPHSTASSIAKACGVSVHQVMLWVKDDRFEVSDDSKVSLYCENCGMKISSGHLCAACQASASKKAQAEALEERMRFHAENMHGTSVGTKKSEDGRMRYL
ncbi:MAG: hypothetical protein K6F35_01440 [Lachnospiraceae bacterium]|nr:hypothetical protein [Lachnospiraceae bacterium]